MRRQVRFVTILAAAVAVAVALSACAPESPQQRLDNALFPTAVGSYQPVTAKALTTAVHQYKKSEYISVSILDNLASYYFSGKAGSDFGSGARIVQTSVYYATGGKYAYAVAKIDAPHVQFASLASDIGAIGRGDLRFDAGNGVGLTNVHGGVVLVQSLTGTHFNDPSFFKTYFAGVAKALGAA
jgi:hypothetical protein